MLDALAQFDRIATEWFYRWLEIDADVHVIDRMKKSWNVL